MFSKTNQLLNSKLGSKSNVGIERDKMKNVLRLRLSHLVYKCRQEGDEGNI
jgi:hypothetical protein